MGSSNSESDTGSTSGEQPEIKDVSSLSLTAVQVTSNPQQDSTIVKLPVSTESETSGLFQENQPCSSNHQTGSLKIPKAKPRKFLRKWDADLERTTISATLKPSSVEEFAEV